MLKETSSAKEKDTKTVKAVHVVARFFLKAVSAIIYIVLNGGDKQYMVTIHQNGLMSCVEAATGETCAACQFGHKCYHKKQCEEIESRRKMHVETNGTLAGFNFDVVARSEEVTQAGDVSVAEHLIDEELSHYVRELRHEGIADLRMRVKRAGLSVASRSKDPLVLALVDHRRAELMALVPATEEIDTPSCLSDAVAVSPKVGELMVEGDKDLAEEDRRYIVPCDPVVIDDGDGQSIYEDLPELPEIQEEVLSAEPLDEEFSEDKAEQWALEALEEADREVAQAPKEPTRAQVIACIRDCVNQLVDFDPDHASNDNGIGPNGTDTEFMHRFADKMAEDAPIRADKWANAAKKLQKYNRTQLGGIVPPMAVVEKALGISTESQRNSAALTKNQGFSLLRR